MDQFHIQSDARSLCISYWPPAPPVPRAGVLFLHGWGSSQRNYRPRADRVRSELGAACLTMDLGGHGGSAGELPSLSARDHVDDALAAYDWLISRDEVDPARVGVCGASYGGYIAVQLAIRRPVSRLFLRAPSLQNDDDFDTPSRDRMASPERRGSKFLQQFGGLSDRTETMILESEHDTEVPPEIIGQYLTASPTTNHRILHGAAHELTEPDWNVAFVEDVIEWFRPL